MAAYLGYTLRMTMLRVMVHDTHTRRSLSRLVDDLTCREHRR